MKKIFVITLFIALIITGCSFKQNTLTLKGDIQNNIISANSTVSGKIIQMTKQQGEGVKQGEIIAVIDNTNQKYAVEQLQAIVNMKQAKLDELQAGARPEQLEQAEAQTRALKAQLDLLLSGTRPEQIEQAEAQVRSAKAQLDLLTSGNRTEQIEQAKYGVLTAQTALDNAQTTYQHTNSEYIKALELNKAGAMSQNDVDNVKYKLDLATKQANASEYQLETVKQQLELLQNGSTTQAIESAQAGYDSANAQLKLLRNGSTKQSIETARANLDSANAQLKLLKSGATTQAITSAHADLDQSNAQLKQAQNVLSNYNIVALADGIIISKNFELGDIVSTGSNIADIAIANDLYVLCYIPDKYLDRIYYDQPVTVKTSIGTQTGRVSYIALKHEYTPKDKQSTSNSEHIATKIKISINDNNGILKSGLTANIEVPLK